jgi:hypothetical protein
LEIKVSIDDIKMVSKNVLNSGSISLAVIGPTAKKDGVEIQKRLYEL